jgi:uncharacterized membrane protein (UPF0127 family)
MPYNLDSFHTPAEPAQGSACSSRKKRERGAVDFVRWVLNAFTRDRRPDVRLTISNRTRQTVLAHCVEVADHGAKRGKGLLGRNSLSPEEGLWIFPCEAVHTFGMKFPIDLVYIDRNMRVKKVRSNVRSWRLSACLSAHSVIELATGTISRTQTGPGDRLECFSAAPLEDGSSASPEQG